jgi:hypothetical protein
MEFAPSVLPPEAYISNDIPARIFWWLLIAPLLEPAKAYAKVMSTGSRVAL